MIVINGTFFPRIVIPAGSISTTTTDFRKYEGARHWTSRWTNPSPIPACGTETPRNQILILRQTKSLDCANRLGRVCAVADESVAIVSTRRRRRRRTTMTTNTNVPEESYNRCNSGENEIFYPIRVYEVGARYVFDCLQILKFELGCFFFLFLLYISIRSQNCFK